MSGTNRAVVIGASMAGLLAARVLSEFFERVTVLDRDNLAATVAPRRGVPQGKHTHGLLARGREILSGATCGSPMSKDLGRCSCGWSTVTCPDFPSPLNTTRRSVALSCGSRTSSLGPSGCSPPTSRCGCCSATCAAPIPPAPRR